MDEVSPKLDPVLIEVLAKITTGALTTDRYAVIFLGRWECRILLDALHEKHDRVAVLVAMIMRDSH